MRYALSQLLPALLLLGTGCSNQELGQNLQLPEFLSVTGPPSPSSAVDFKRTTAVVDVHGWVNSEVFLRYALNEEDLRSIQAEEATGLCEENGSVRNCSFTFPSGNVLGSDRYPDGETLHYLWIVEYQLPEGEEVAYVEAEVGTCSIVPPQGCSFTSDCPGSMVCARDERTADPTGDTLARLVCMRTEPNS